MNPPGTAALTLSLRQAPAQRIDMRALAPSRLAGLSLAEIEAIPLCQGNRAIAAGELFRISGADPRQLRIESDSDRLDHIGAELSEGSVHVAGPAGAYLGRGMRGGRIEVEGDCGVFAGNAMTGGGIEIRGDAGSFLGAATAGERRGMAGGWILVRGNAGDRVGDHQRRGMILIEGDCGHACAARMVAGSILVGGNTGEQTGTGMRRGSLMLARMPTSLPRTFNDNGVQRLGFLPLLAARLPADSALLRDLLGRLSPARRWLGDLACGGLGEILIAAD